MKYAVGWTPEALQDLATVWMESAEPAAVNAATSAIDHDLAENPLNKRHEVVRGHGIAIHAPLGVDFEVSPVERNVIVTAAWLVSEASE